MAVLRWCNHASILGTATPREPNQISLIYKHLAW